MRFKKLRRRLLDRLCLLPSRQPLDYQPQTRFLIESECLRLECFRQRQIPSAAAASSASNQRQEPDFSCQPDLLIVKWAGNAGRAERSTLHPANAWPNQYIEVWTINPPGYGGSPGRASLDHGPTMATAVRQAIEQFLPSVPVLVFGNSIGTIAAMHLVRQLQTSLTQHQNREPLRETTPNTNRLCGLFLRNPPHLPTLIAQYYARWYHLGVPTWLVQAWEAEVDSVTLAAGLHCPMLLLQSELDKMVPPWNQNLVFDAYAGPKQKYVFPDADHDDLPSPHDAEGYLTYLSAIRACFGGFDTDRS